jgi:cbb3-type cytochrome oxidase cytochrome c subunit
MLRMPSHRGTVSRHAGPDLTEVGKRWRIDYLWGQTVNPRDYSAVSFMPKFDLTDDEIKALVVFLKSRRGMNFSETTMEQYRAHLQQISLATGAGTADSTPSPARGEQLMSQRSCTACHRLDDKDGHIAPDLSFEGLIRDENWLMDDFEEPRSRIPDSIMRCWDSATSTTARSRRT